MSGRLNKPEALLALGSVVLFLALAEAAIRVGVGETPPVTGYAPVNTDNRGKVARNAAGYRDLERARDKPPGVRRLLCLGDSFTWGVGVEFDDAYPQRLQRGLKRRRREDWEVVNLALPGFRSVDEATQLAEEGLAYDPDVVLLGYVLNDSQDAGSPEARRAEDWVKGGGPPAGFWERSALLRFVVRRVWATLENRRRVRGYRQMYADDAAGWVAARKALQSMGDLCRSRRVPFVVAIFPLFGNPLDGSYPFAEIHLKVAAAAGAAGARVVDLLPVYRGLRSDTLVVNGAADEHPNEVAHRIAAGALLRALDDVLPPPSAPE